MTQSIKFKTKTEIVFEKIHKKIIDGELKPGQRIIISDIAKEFGTSEIPVREAIRKIESEGLVKITPHVGAIVSLIEPDEYSEIYLIRTELEVLATKLAAPHITESVINVLNECMQRAELAIKADDYKQLGALDKEFHLRIYKTAPYPLLFKNIVDLWDRYGLKQCVFSYVPKRVVPSWKEHKLIVDALEENNASLAARLVRQQKNRTKKAINKVLNKAAK